MYVHPPTNHKHTIAQNYSRAQANDKRRIKADHMHKQDLSIPTPVTTKQHQEKRESSSNSIF